MHEEIDNKQILKQLQATDIFADIPAEILERNLSQLKVQHFNKDEYIIRKDEVGDCMFILIEGKVKVHDDDFIVAHLHKGDYFGEMSLLHSAPRSMSVSTLESVELICINQDSFYNILKDQPELIQKIISHLVIRLRSQNNVLIEELRSREEDLKHQVEEQTYLYREQKERAEQSEKFKQQFLANMSHEIRTPMNAVMGMTSLLIDKQPRTDQIHYLEGIKKSGDILLHIINDILDLSKIEAGKMELEKIDFSIHEVILQVVETLQHKADEKDLQLKKQIEDTIPSFLIGDPVRLNQIIMNLMGNAIKFTEKGSVSIVLQLVEAAEMHATICISVIDTGIGIPADKIETIFEGFSQANTSDTRKFGGTGLGLTISRQLVEMMGGNINISSKEAQYENDSAHGTTFSFTILFEIGSEERLLDRTSSKEQIDGNILNGKKILIVDDNEYNRIVATDTLLSKSKVEITTAGSGLEAIDALKKNEFDVILLDLQMPEMDGYETTKCIREGFEAPKKDTPIIALTASVLRNDIDRCHEVGMNSYITKPFKASQLIAGIAHVLGLQIEYIKQLEIKQHVDTIIESKMTNLNYLQNFCEGDEARMTKYITMFTSSVPGLIEKLNAALASSNYEEIANQVHGCRTKLVMMGMEQSKLLAIEIEKECRDHLVQSKPVNKINLLIRQIEKANDELRLG